MAPRPNFFVRSFLPDRRVVPRQACDRPVVAIAACYVGPADRAEATIAPLRKWGTIVADQLRPISYVELQSLFDAARPTGRRSLQFLGSLARCRDRNSR